MPKFELQLCCDLDNVSLCVDGVTRWAITVKCSNCQTEHATPVYLDPAVKVAIPGSRGEAHLVMKCKVGSWVD